MIHKFEGIYGTMLVLHQTDTSLSKEIEDVVLKIQEEKKFPFNDVYAKIPGIVFQKFLDLCDLKNLKYKDIEIKKNIFLVKF